jgi:CRISPR-associated endonuclease/helicase Cas3
MEHWLSRLGLLHSEDENPDGIRVHVLMGGDLDTNWDRHPEDDAILIGTQDMLLSRALNRGYAMSRFRWPVHYGLLNNDCLWIMDEVQIMGSGLTTSVQMDAFRRKMGTILPCKTVWMSATCPPEWLKTVDRDAPEPDRVLELTDEDRKEKGLNRILKASKIPVLEDLTLDNPSKDGLAEYVSGFRDVILKAHTRACEGVATPITLAIVNTVTRAQMVYDYLRDHLDDGVELLLLHSRFRPGERKRLTERIGEVSTGINGRIIISTQVIEAGVDLSADAMVTELAPWSSLVQRWGRLNRRGDLDRSHTYIIGIDDEGKRSKECCAPYQPEEIRYARSKMTGLDDVSPNELDSIELPPVKREAMIRSKDVFNLFNTMADVTGFDIDISRFIRDSVDKDASVLWRKWERKESPSDKVGPDREELCSVPVASLRSFARSREVWYWDYMEGVWSRAFGDRITPGQIYLLRSDDGGYTEELGWTGSKKGTVDEIPEEGGEMESTSSDGLVRINRWIELSEHLEDVRDEMEILCDGIGDSLGSFGQLLRTASFYHDIGKAHPVFQSAMRDRGPPETGTLWAKSGSDGPLRYDRHYFRHELASALALLSSREILQEFEEWEIDLITYLIGAHHGKVRDLIRSIPDEVPPSEGGERRYAMGIWEGDQISRIELGDGRIIPETPLSLASMEIGISENGHRSWIQMCDDLKRKADLGIFRIAYLESLLRVADWRASAKEEAE